MKRSKPTTVAMEPEIWNILVEKVGPGNISQYIYTAMVEKLIAEGKLTAEDVLTMYSAEAV